MNYIEIEILNRLPERQFKNFCFTFFATLGLTDIEAVVTTDSGCVTGKGKVDFGFSTSYHFVFIGKRQVGIIHDEVIQKLRDTMDRETNKGLVLSTGYFSRQAKRQAKIKGKPPIDLIDGSNLIERLKKNHLTFSVETGEVSQMDNLILYKRAK